MFVVLVGAQRDASGIGPLRHRVDCGSLGAAVAFVGPVDVPGTDLLGRRAGDDTLGYGVDTVLPEVGVDVAVVVGDDGNAGEKDVEHLLQYDVYVGDVHDAVDVGDKNGSTGGASDAVGGAVGVAVVVPCSAPDPSDGNRGDALTLWETMNHAARYHLGFLFEIPPFHLRKNRLLQCSSIQ